MRSASQSFGRAVTGERPSATSPASRMRLSYSSAAPSASSLALTPAISSGASASTSLPCALDTQRRVYSERVPSCPQAVTSAVSSASPSAIEARSSSTACSAASPPQAASGTSRSAVISAASILRRMVFHSSVTVFSAAGSRRIMSVGVMPYSPSSPAAISPARPCRYTAARTASRNGS